MHVIIFFWWELDYKTNGRILMKICCKSGCGTDEARAKVIGTDLVPCSNPFNKDPHFVCRSHDFPLGEGLQKLPVCPACQVKN